MKLRHYAIAAALAVATPAAAQAGEMFTGDTKLACEAVLCLASGTQPSECTPALTRFFSISARKLSDTIKARKNFLSLCPSASADNNMRDLTDSLANGAGRCDVEALNRNRFRIGGHDGDGISRISSAMPAYCRSLYQHPYMQGELPRYVGDPDDGGYWVKASEYDAALARYNEEHKDNGWGRKETGWTGGGWNGSSRIPN